MAGFAIGVNVILSPQLIVDSSATGPRIRQWARLTESHHF